MKKIDFNFRDIAEFANDVIIVTKSFPLDPPGPEIVYVNKAFTELTGYTEAEILGKNPRILQSEKTDKNTTQIIRQGLENKAPVRVTIRNFSKIGKEYWLDLSILPLKDPDGKVTHFVAIERDVTEQKNIERELEILSKTDSLTGLLNRRAFDSILKDERNQFKQTQNGYSLLMLDIDHFKAINDTYGHTIGDEAIQSFAKVCSSELRAKDKMARVGGEEFCVLLPSTDIEKAYSIAENLRKKVSNTSLKSKNKKISLTVSIGVSEAEYADSCHTDILKRVDKNLYQAKKTGRNKVCLEHSVMF